VWLVRRAATWLRNLWKPIGCTVRTAVPIAVLKLYANCLPRNLAHRGSGVHAEKPVPADLPARQCAFFHFPTEKTVYCFRGIGNYATHEFRTKPLSRIPGSGSLFVGAAHGTDEEDRGPWGIVEAEPGPGFSLPRVDRSAALRRKHDHEIGRMKWSTAWKSKNVF